MRESSQTFGSFAVGDTVIFERAFRSEEFEPFSALSGDCNALHHDAECASRTSLGKPIVPLHMTLAPLSMVAGMVFPGEPSLYLGHEVRASKPVYFGETLRYSARLESINDVHRILEIRVLALHGTDVVLDAVMRVQAQMESWQTPPAMPVQRANSPKRALVTGASGEIGGAIARLLAQRGWNLLLQDRGADERRDRLEGQLRRLQAPHGRETSFVKADLTQTEGQGVLATAAAELEDIALVVHVASPPLTASLEDLVLVNYGALRRVTEAALPGMLAHQQGTIVTLGSVATERTIPGWEDYSAAKAMATQYVTSVNRSCSAYGVRGIVVMPGLVATAFSQAHRRGLPALLPQELAEEMWKAVEARSNTAIIIETSGVREGAVGFHTPAARTATPSQSGQTASATQAGDHEQRMEHSDCAVSARAADIIQKKLKLPADYDLSTAAMGTTPGWDSLRHIELILELEGALNLRFTSNEIECMQTFDQIETICRNRLQG